MEREIQSFPTDRCNAAVIMMLNKISIISPFMSCIQTILSKAFLQLQEKELSAGTVWIIHVNLKSYECGYRRLKNKFKHKIYFPLVCAHLISKTQSSQRLLCLNVALKGLVIAVNLLPKLWMWVNEWVARVTFFTLVKSPDILSITGTQRATLRDFIFPNVPK